MPDFTTTTGFGGFGAGGAGAGGGGGGWSEHGVQFILQAIDMASEELEKVRKAYDRLVDAIHKTQRAAISTEQPIERLSKSVSRFGESTNKTLAQMRTFYRSQEIVGSISEKVGKIIHTITDRMHSLYDRIFKNRKEMELGNKSLEESHKLLQKDFDLKSKMLGLLEKFKGVGAVISTTLAQIGTKLGAGGGILAGLSGLAAAIGVYRAADLDLAMKETALATKMSADEFRKYEQAIKNAAIATKSTYEEVERLGIIVVKSGIRSKKAMEELLTISIKFADIMKVGRGTAVEFASTLVRMGVPLEQVKDTLSGIREVVARGLLTPEEAMYTVKAFLPIINVLEKQIPNASKETKSKLIVNITAAASALSKTFEGNTEAISRMLRAMVDKTSVEFQTVQKVLQGFGKATFEEFEKARKAGDITGMLEAFRKGLAELAKSSGEYSAIIAQVFGVSIEELGRFIALEEGAIRKMGQLGEAGRKNAKAIDKDWNELMSTFQKSMGRIYNAISNILIEIGKPLMKLATPVLSSIADVLESINSWLKDASGWVKTFISASAGFVGFLGVLSAASFTMRIFGKEVHLVTGFFKAWGFIPTLFRHIISGASGILSYFIQISRTPIKFTTVKEEAAGLLSKLRELGSVLRRIPGWIGDLVKSIPGLIVKLKDLGNVLLALSIKAWPILAIGGAIAAAILIWQNWDKIVKAVGKSLEWVGEKLSKIIGFFKKLFGIEKTAVPAPPTAEAPTAMVKPTPPVEPTAIAATATTIPAKPTPAEVVQTMPLAPKVSTVAGTTAPPVATPVVAQPAPARPEVVERVTIQSSKESQIPKIETKVDVHQAEVVRKLEEIKQIILSDYNLHLRESTKGYHSIFSQKKQAEFAYWGEVD